MKYDSALRPAVLARRYKRFLADVTTDSGDALTIHCPNTGSMLGCAEPGSRVWMSRSDNPARKYAHTWEQVETVAGVRVGIHTGRANTLVAEAIEAGVIAELARYATVQREVAVEPGSRMDFVLDAPGRRRCVVEVKNVSAAVDGGVGFFPDAVSTRALKHLAVLQRRREAGERAVLVFCVQRDDVHELRPADHIDPAYGEGLRAALAAGVEACAYAAQLSSAQVRLTRAVPVRCPD